MKKADLVIAILLIGLSAYVFYEASGFPKSIVAGAPSASRFPFVLATLLLILSIILFVQATGLLSKTKAVEDPKEKINWKALGKIAIAIICISAFLVLAETIDIFILIPLLLLSIMLLMGERNVIALIAVPVCFDLFVFFVFYKTFGVALPTIYF